MWYGAHPRRRVARSVQYKSARLFDRDRRSALSPCRCQRANLSDAIRDLAAGMFGVTGIGTSASCGPVRHARNRPHSCPTASSDTTTSYFSTWAIFEDGKPISLGHSCWEVIRGNRHCVSTSRRLARESRLRSPAPGHHRRGALRPQYSGSATSAAGSSAPSSPAISSGIPARKIQGV